MARTKVKSLKDRIADVVHTISTTTEKPLLEKDVETLKKLEGELKTIDKEVNALKKTLETEVKRLKALETKVEQLRNQVKQLLEENGKLDGKNMQLEERVVNLEEQVVDVKNDNTFLRKQVVDMKNDNTFPKEDNTSLRKEVQLLKHELGKLVSSDDELVLGELCCQIQSMIFKKVLPPSEYSERAGYNLKYMKEEISQLGEGKAQRVKQAWAKLKQELNYQEEDIERLTSTMGKLQSKRNVTAHPDLTEQTMIQSVKRMKNEEKLKGMFYTNFKELIRL